jgi:hypothetical protein
VEGLAVLAQADENCIRGAAPAMSTENQELRVVFDAPPGRNMPTLVEIEDQSGRPIDIGHWRARPDGYWELVIPMRQP